MTVVNTTPPTYYGLSTETKPTVNVPGGSAWIEEDTSKTYLFNEDTKQWYEFGNGGGGSSVSDLFVVNVTLAEDAEENLVATADKTLADTLSASGAGKRVLIRVSDETGEYSELQDVYPNITPVSMSWYISYISRGSGENGELIAYDFEWTDEGVETISVDYFAFDADYHGW